MTSALMCTDSIISARPCFKPFCLTTIACWPPLQDLASWSRDGVAGLQSVVLYSLPELDGAIDTVPLGGLVGDNIYLVEERVHRLAGRLKSWVNLRRTPPKVQPDSSMNPRPFSVPGSALASDNAKACQRSQVCEESPRRMGGYISAERSFAARHSTQACFKCVSRLRLKVSGD